MAQQVISKLKILIIEDESHIRGIIRQILQRIGVEHIFESEEGGDGFMQTIRHRPDLVLCDIHMDPVDGLKYLQTLRTAQIEVVKDTPVVFLTSNADHETVLRAKEYMVNGYLVKPVSLNDVKKQIGRALGIVFP